MVVTHRAPRGAHRITRSPHARWRLPGREPFCREEFVPLLLALGTIAAGAVLGLAAVAVAALAGAIA